MGSNTIKLFCRSVRQTKKIFAGNIKYFGQCDNFVVGNETCALFNSQDCQIIKIISYKL